MDQSILNSTKKVLQIDLDDPSFDQDVITHINSAFSNLYQLGIGPLEGFEIEDDSAEWADIGIDSIPIIHEIKTIVYLRVRILFDPPTTSYLLAAMENQIEEHEWRINAMREDTEWIDPNPEAVLPDG
jgi:hypothetical protein